MFVLSNSTSLAQTTEHTFRHQPVPGLHDASYIYLIPYIASDYLLVAIFDALVWSYPTRTLTHSMPLPVPLLSSRLCHITRAVLCKGGLIPSTYPGCP